MGSGDDVQELRVAIGRVARRLRQVYAAQGGPAFTEVAVLAQLARDGPASPSELAGRERVTSAAVAASLRQLAADGLVTRTPHPSDRRRTVVALTGAGRAALGDREQAVRRAMADALARDFDPDERAALFAVVPLLDRLAGAI
jgi:DNA-binding MarR family transcriptional regulator